MLFEGGETRREQARPGPTGTQTHLPFMTDSRADRSHLPKTSNTSAVRSHEWVIIYNLSCLVRPLSTHVQFLHIKPTRGLFTYLVLSSKLSLIQNNRLVLFWVFLVQNLFSLKRNGSVYYGVYDDPCWWICQRVLLLHTVKCVYIHLFFLQIYNNL